MDRNEFLDELSRSLKGRIDDNELRRQIDFYSDYIKGEIDKGRSEYEVLNELGAPRLIAKTIIQTYHLKDDPIRNQYKNENTPDAETDESTGYTENNRFFKKFHKSLTIIIVVLVALVVVGAVFSLITFLLPVAFMLIFVFVLVKIITNFTGKGKR